MRDWTHYRAQVAGMTGTRPPDDPELLAAKANLRAARLTDRARQTARAIAEAAPELAPDQRDIVAGVLGPALTALAAPARATGSSGVE